MLDQRPRLDVRRPFTRAAALAAGVSRSRLESREFVSVIHGVFVHRSVPITPKLRVQALLLVHPPSAAASHASAARVLGLPLPTLPDEHVAVLRREDRRRTGTIRHHVARPDARVVTVDGIRVSAPDQLFGELASQLSLVDLVVVGDAMVRRRWVTPEQLVAAVAGLAGAAGRLARRAASLVRRGVDSPMETKLRLLIVLAGLPEPTVNFTIFWDDGRVRFRFDLSWPDLKLVVEYDGRQHRDDLDQWDTDIARRDWMDAHDWALVPVVARGIHRRPDETLTRIVAALRKAGARGLPFRLDEEWRRHFPVIA